MLNAIDADVIVAGGGVAGVAAAAALRTLGCDVLVVEPGQKGERRLAGELFHPPGTAGLAQLGLIDALGGEPATKIGGFFVSSERGCVRLPYDAVRAHRMPGLSLEHSLIRDRLIKAAAALPNVTVKEGARVVGMVQGRSSHVTVTVSDSHGVDSYRCRLLVVADGSPSRLARCAGITVRQRRISTVWAYRIGTANFLEHDFGHVYLGGETPILVYPIGQNQARILFDIPYRPDRRATAVDCLALAKSLPDALREEVAGAIATQQRMSVVTQATSTLQAASGRVVLVGDAGGACHPLTATGMTMCISDAMILRAALADRLDDLQAGLRLYARRRRWPQATRLVLAGALRDAFCGSTPALRVLQGGIIALWRDSPEGRATTLALLSTAEGRPSVFLRQVVKVMIRGLIAHRRSPPGTDHRVGMLRIARSLIVDFFRRWREVLFGPVGLAPTRGPSDQRG